MSVDNTGARFSVVIVNYNGGALLTDCVQSVVRENVPAAQIIVVDNGSRDDSVLQLERGVPGVKIIHNSCNAGFARAVNQGLAQSSADFVLLLNNDAQLQPGALHAFAEAFDRIPKLAIAGGQLRHSDGRLQNAIAPFPTLAAEIIPRALLQWMFPRRFRGKSDASAPIAVESVIGACLCVRRSALEKLGPMGEDYFFFMEETDWCRRAHRLGLEVYYIPAAQAIHVQGHTANRFRSDARIEFQRSKLIYFKNNRARSVYWFISVLLPAKAFINALANSLACILTLFTVKNLRAKSRGYWRIAAWHALARPASWGLPDKCPPQEK
ncbi:MAG TPA: glycosyltransferase family 2 protein [Candidatus Acidoferrales bacterium]|nr:glycosyltransferase family 2 protein [Candidatus Acidoferrales bacterium]